MTQYQPETNRHFKFKSTSDTPPEIIGERVPRNLFWKLPIGVMNDGFTIGA